MAFYPSGPGVVLRGVFLELCSKLQGMIKFVMCLRTAASGLQSDHHSHRASSPVTYPSHHDIASSDRSERASARTTRKAISYQWVGSHKSEFECPFEQVYESEDGLPQGILHLTPKAGDVIFIPEQLFRGSLKWKPKERERRFMIYRYVPQYLLAWECDLGRSASVIHAFRGNNSPLPMDRDASTCQGEAR